MLATGGSSATLIQHEAAGIPVLVTDAQDFDGTCASIRLIGRSIGASTAAERVIEKVQREVAAIMSKVASASSHPRVCHELDAGDPAKLYTVGPGSFVDEIISLAGDQNIAAAAPTQYPALSAEEIVSANPQVITFADVRAGVTPEVMAARPGWSQIDAVRTGRVYALDDRPLSRPGSRRADGLREMARAIHPDRFIQLIVSSGAAPAEAAPAGRRPRRQVAPRPPRPAPTLAVLAGLVALSLVVGAGLGAVAIPPTAIADMLTHRLGLATWQPDEEAIILTIRLPRVVAGALVGVALAIAVALFQGLFRNRLADPYIIGASAGAAVGATVASLSVMPWLGGSGDRPGTGVPGRPHGGRGGLPAGPHRRDRLDHGTAPGRHGCERRAHRLDESDAVYRRPAPATDARALRLALRQHHHGELGTGGSSSSIGDEA